MLQLTAAQCVMCWSGGSSTVNPISLMNWSQRMYVSHLPQYFAHMLLLLLAQVSHCWQHFQKRFVPKLFTLVKCNE